MTIGGGIVGFGILWFLALFWVLPFRIRSQSEANEVVPGTPPSAPVQHGLRWKLVVATGVAVVLWVVYFLIVHFNLIPISIRPH